MYYYLRVSLDGRTCHNKSFRGSYVSRMSTAVLEGCICNWIAVTRIHCTISCRGVLILTSYVLREINGVIDSI